VPHLFRGHALKGEIPGVVKASGKEGRMTTDPIADLLTPEFEMVRGRSIREWICLLRS